MKLIKYICLNNIFLLFVKYMSNRKTLDKTGFCDFYRLHMILYTLELLRVLPVLSYVNYQHLYIKLCIIERPPSPIDP